MLDAKVWMDEYTRRMRALFGGRVRMIGLQGSYGRGEADEGSDIDPVLILDTWTQKDSAVYRAALGQYPERAMICGFAGGAGELAAWDRADLFQFVRDTTSWYGSLESLTPPTDASDAARAAHRGACDLYHTLVHHSVHGDNPELLPQLLKGAVFVLQARCFVRTGVYLRRHQDLEAAVEGAEKALLRSARLCRHRAASQDEEREWSPVLLAWLSDVIRQGEITAD